MSAAIGVRSKPAEAVVTDQSASIERSLDRPKSPTPLVMESTISSMQPASLAAKDPAERVRELYNALGDCQKDKNSHLAFLRSVLIKPFDPKAPIASDGQILPRTEQISKIIEEITPLLRYKAPNLKIHEYILAVHRLSRARSLASGVQASMSVEAVINKKKESDSSS